ncbi:MAG: DNA polymerase III subunit delta [Eubacteriales bacterium]|nr:DNA polymerase III subunit delta [Eubacteriales bacterium]
MNSKDFFGLLKEDLRQNCFIFEGDEEYLKQSALLSLKEKIIKPPFGDINYSVLEDPDDKQLISLCETLPLMADKRLIVVKDSRFIQEGVGKSKTPKQQENLSKYLENLSSSSVLVFYCKGKSTGNKKIVKQIKKNGGQVIFDSLSEASLIKWIARELKKYGKKTDSQTAQYLLFICGSDMTVLSNELAKAALVDISSDVLTKRDIDLICTKTREYRVFDLSEQVAAGESANAVRLMNGLIEDGEARLLLLSLLQRQYRQMLFAKILKEASKQNSYMAQVLGVPPFVVAKLLKTTENYSVSDLKKAYKMLIDSEYSVKSGEMPELGSLESAVYRLLVLKNNKVS